MRTSTDGWQAWLDEHGATLLLFARQHVASLVDAEDAVQDAFVRFWRSREHVRDPLAYLYACVRTAALDLRRGAHRRRERESHAARSADEAWFDKYVGEADRREAIDLRRPIRLHLARASSHRSEARRRRYARNRRRPSRGARRLPFASPVN